MINQQQQQEVAQQANQHEKEIDLKRLYRLFKKRLWILVLLTVLLTSLGSVYVSMPRTPLYESSTRIYLQADEDLFNTVKVIMREPAVLKEVINELELQRSPEALRGQISVAGVDGSTVLRLSVVDTDPIIASTIANTIVNGYEKVSRDT